MKKFKIFLIFAIIVTALTAAVCLASCSVGTGGGKGKGGDAGCYDLSDLRAQTSPYSYDYDGTEKTVEIFLWDNKTLVTRIFQNQEHDDLITEYSDNVNAGTVTVTIKPKSGSKKFKGETQATFTIHRVDAYAGDLATLKDILLSGNHYNVSLTADVEVPQDKTLVVPEDARLLLSGYDIVCYGKFENHGYVSPNTEYSGKGNMYFYGQTVNTGMINVNTSAKLVNKGDFTNDGKIYGKSSSVYTDSDFSGNGSIDEGVNFYRSYPFSEAEISLSFNRADYTGKEIKPKFSVKMHGQSVPVGDYDYVYSDNVNAGTATITFYAEANAKYVRGKTSTTFVIDKAAKIIYHSSDFSKALANENYYLVDARDITSLVDSRFTVPEGMEVLVAGAQLYDVTVNGTLAMESTDRVPVRIDGKITNNGKVTMDGITALYGELSGGGEYEINGKIYFASQAVVAEGTAVTNKGKAFADATVNGLNNAENGTLTLREQVDETCFTLSSTEFDYDGKVKSPNLIFSEREVKSSTYYESYQYEGQTDWTSPKNVGKIKGKISFTEYSETYYGQAWFSFEIKPVATSVNTDKALVEACTSGNYHTVEANGDFTFYSGVKVIEGVELIIPEDKCILMEAKLTINGKLTVNGTYSDGRNGSSDTTDTGEIVNDGEAYFNGSVPERTTGDGTFYVRKHIEQAEWVGFETEVAYHNGNIKQQFSLKMSDGTVLEDEHRDYWLYYTNNTNVSVNNQAKITATSEAFSKFVYGETTKSFSITEGSIGVDNFEDFLDAVNDVVAGKCNYKDIYITADFEATNTTLGNIRIEIRSNTTLHVDNHEVNFKPGEHLRSYDIVNNGVILVNAGNQYWYRSALVTFSGNPFTIVSAG